MTTKRIVFIIIASLAAILAMAACGQTPTKVDSVPVARTGQGEHTVATPAPVAVGQNGAYMPNYALPAVTTVYIITGTVQAAPGSVMGYSMSGQWSSSSSKYGGYGSGSISGGTDGKSIILFKIDDVDGVHYFDPYVEAGITQRAEDWTPVVDNGQLVIIKAEDRKAVALGAGFHVTLMCREQYEWVQAVAGNEIPVTREVTRELDYCRLITPNVFTPPPDEAQGR